MDGLSSTRKGLSYATTWGREVRTRPAQQSAAAETIEYSYLKASLATHLAELRMELFNTGFKPNWEHHTCRIFLLFFF